MRLLIVNYEYPPLGGGGGVASRDLAEALARRHEVTVLTSAGPGLPAAGTVNGVRIVRAPVWGRHARSTASMLSMVSFWPIGLRAGRGLLARESFDLVNTWFAVPSGPAGLRLAREAGVPHVLSMAGGDIYDPSKWYTPDKNPVLGRVVRGVLGASDALVAVSSDLARRAREIHGCERPIEVISLAADAPSFTPASRAALGLAPDKVYVITVGRLVRRKNLDRLIEAVAGLNRSEIEVIVVGDGPEQGRLAAIAAERGLSGRVHFKGFVAEEVKHQLLAAADIFALPSLHEAFGLVYLEAMHCGLPVIAAKPGGQEDFLEDGETGYLVSPDDIEGLRRSLQRLTLDRERRRQIGEANRDRATRFTIAAMAGRYEALFERSIRDHHQLGAAA